MSEAGTDGRGADGPGAAQAVLRAVLVADAVGYSRLMPEDPAGTILSLNRQRARMREIVGRHNGRDAGFPGDLLLALFTAAGDALGSAMEFLDGQGGSADPVPLQFRVGLHVGDVFESSGEALGVAVNVAARLQQSAPVGGILMSQTFRESLPGRLRVPARDIGELTLKNVTEPVRAFEVQVPAAGPARPPPPAVAPDRREAPRGRPRIFIRPFRALGTSERAQVFADGIVEELVTTLGVFSDVFRVVQAERPSDNPDGYEIVGQVRNGDRLRITCQLVDRANGQTLWTNRFDFQTDASYDAQERIAVAVIDALHLKLTEGETTGLWSNRTTSLAAWEQFHRARMCEARYTAESNRRSRIHFARAIEIDPDFVPAIVGLGFSHLDAVRIGWSTDHDRDLAEALRAARLALAKDGADAYAVALLAYVERAQGKSEQSTETMARAIRIAPRNPELVAYFAAMLWMNGNAAGAVEQNRRALDLMPQPNSWIRSNLGLALLWDGRPQEAEAVFGAVLGDDADYSRAYIGLAVALVRQGRMEAARTAYRRLTFLDPGFTPASWIAPNLHFNPADSDRFIADLTRASLPEQGAGRS